jgi:hypothetical protein
MLQELENIEYQNKCKICNENMIINNDRLECIHCAFTLYKCTNCNSFIYVDPELIFSFRDICNAYKFLKNGPDNFYDIKNAYTKEIEPNKWLTFCRRSCEIKYYLNIS